jgi:glycosyltransferase involved in cell wall biosynthesis
VRRIGRGRDTDVKLLLVNHLLDPVSGGGTAERSFQLARFLAAAGAECTVLALDIGITAERRTELGGVRLVAVPCRNLRFFVPRLPRAELERLVGAADVVHLSGHWTLLNAHVSAACRRLGKPYLFCPAGALKRFGRSLWLKRAYDLAVGQRIVAAAARCVAITDDERADFVARGVPAKRITVIPNGIDPQQYALADPARAIADFRAAHQLGESPFVLFLGRLNAIKGPDLLLDAFAAIAARFPHHRLVFAGPDGGLQAALAERAREFGLGARVHFAGFVGGAAKAAALRAASLLAIPSRREAMSIVVLEAGACGCPVLFTDTCGLAAIAQAGAATMVAPDAAAIASGLAAALADADALTQAAERLAAIVARDYLWPVQAARYAALCREALGEATR